MLTQQIPLLVYLIACGYSSKMKYLDIQPEVYLDPSTALLAELHVSCLAECVLYCVHHDLCQDVRVFPRPGQTGLYRCELLLATPSDTHRLWDGTVYIAEICRTTQLGREYQGRDVVTRHGLPCQRWDAQYPHEHGLIGSGFREGSLSAAENYCCNPDDEIGGPWCYTLNPGVRWEYCHIPFCEGVDVTYECKDDVLGRTYRGNKTTTLSGRECQQWSSQYPHDHSVFWYGFPEGDLVEAKNFCRNPDGEPGGPWCYTTDENVRWEYCDVPLC